MSRSARIGILVATAVLLVLAFVVLSPGDDDEPANTVATPTATSPVTPPAGPGETATVAPELNQPATPKYTPLVVRDGKPVGGVQKVEVHDGDQVRLQISSPDTSDEIHIHGYDLMKDLEAGGRVRFAFTANADGIFEIELEDAGVQIAELVVEP